MDWTDIEREQLLDKDFDEELAEILNADVKEFDAWEDEIEQAPEGHGPKVQFFNKKKLPERVDWREEKNVITPIKHQGSCGSCWAFTSAGVIEGSYAIKTGKKIEVSEQ